MKHFRPAVLLLALAVGSAAPRGWAGPAATASDPATAPGASSESPAAHPATTPPHAQTSAAKPATPKAFPQIDGHDLHNAHRVTEKVLSGAQPEGEGSFRKLREWGVQTIISVDGAKPDVEGAKKYGMRYVHLPIGYDGVDPAEGKAIAKAIEEMPGRVYVHCHHGRHRSAAAVAVACVYAGMLPPGRAEDVLKTFGTGENYAGLWQAAREAKPLPPEEIRNFEVEFVEAATITETAGAMVQVDQRWDHLKAVQKAGWKAPPDHPDIDPPHEALLLQELLHEMRRVESAHSRVPDYMRRLSEGEAGAGALREALAASPVDAAAAEAAFKRVAASCAACHKAYRD